ncbi:MAG: DUF881 domain-containing protein [Christensenellales bacterium]|jgi:uncharacterized protein YlxW (UPF0749 family)
MRLKTVRKRPVKLNLPQGPTRPPRPRRRETHWLWLLLGLTLGVGLLILLEVTGRDALQRAPSASPAPALSQAERDALEDRIAQLQAQLDRAERLAGSTEVTGAGVRIRIAPKAGSLYTVLDENLLVVVNELNACGAQAVSINGQRFTAATEIRSTGNGVNINTFPTGAPYEVLAVGDPEVLAAGMDMYGGVLDRMRERFEVTLERADGLTVPAYTGQPAAAQSP